MLISSNCAARCPKYASRSSRRGLIGASIRKIWASVAEAEAAVTNAALSRGWADFDRTRQSFTIAWLKRSELWPAGWPTLAELAITEAEQAARRQQDERDRIATTTVKRQMHYSGGTFTFGVDAMGSLADQISALVAVNTPLLNTSSRIVRGQAPKLHRSAGGGSGSGGGGGGGGNPNRMTDEERSLVGFFGEVIAFEWLKRKFSAKRIVMKVAGSLLIAGMSTAIPGTITSATTLSS